MSYNTIIPQNGDFSRTQELNERLYSRNIPDTHLENWFSPKSVSTRFTKMPITYNSNNKKQIPSPETAPKYNIEKTFAAPTSKAPFSGFYTNVDTESSLRNQFYSLQKSNQSIYVPSSNSELYNIKVVGRQETQTHPILFNKYIPQKSSIERPNIKNIGNDRWFNHTRTQLRNEP